MIRAEIRFFSNMHYAANGKFSEEAHLSFVWRNFGFRNARRISPIRWQGKKRTSRLIVGVLTTSIFCMVKKWTIGHLCHHQFAMSPPAQMKRKCSIRRVTVVRGTVLKTTCPTVSIIPHLSIIPISPSKAPHPRTQGIRLYTQQRSLHLLSRPFIPQRSSPTRGHVHRLDTLQSHPFHNLTFPIRV